MNTFAPSELAPPAGAAATATHDAVAEPSAVSQETGQPAAVAAVLCANCGARLLGQYCSECGQRHHHQPVHHFWHFIGEAAEDLTHADSRLWQTLIALLFRPGFLTREFLDGRRVRYLPPVRLYLVVSVIFFIIAGLSSHVPNNPALISESGGNLQYQALPARKPRGLGAVAKVPGKLARGIAGGITAAAPTPAARRSACERAGRYLERNGGWVGLFGPRVTRNCQVVVAEGGLKRLNESVTHNLERAMFLFLPLLALIMKPLYLKPPRHYVEHLLFFLHNHAFLFVVLGAVTLVKMATSSRWVLDPLDTALTIYIPVYFYRAMRRVYGQGRWLTLSKLSTLAAAYFVLGIALLVATVSYSFLML
jgi:hypothetical protein